MSLPFREHPQRHLVTAELHARAYDRMQAPARVAHLASLCGEKGTGRNVRHLKRLLRHYDRPVPDFVGQHHTEELGSIHLRWERHTEFVTYTFTQPGAFTDPFADPVLNALPQDWLCDIPGDIVTAALVALEPRDARERTGEDLAALFEGHPIIGSEVVGGLGRAWSALRIHSDGYSRILVQDRGLSENQAGRLIRRLLEINAYRAMALLGLPLAREVSVCLGDADQRLVAVAARLAQQEGAQDPVLEEELLAELTSLAAEIEAVAARTSYRFEASRAYYRVVQQRLDQLRQGRIEGFQTFAEFLDARLAPAIATCNSTSHRQQDLAERAARLTSLLRARVEVSLQEQNRRLLESMDRRAKIQLRLQETVEGLSVIAIGYYGVGLIGYALKGLEAKGLPIDAVLGMGLAMPLVVGIAWFALKRTRKRLHREGSEEP